MIDRPFLSNLPNSVAIVTGNSRTISVTASGQGPFTYQWYAGTSGDTSNPVGSDSPSYTTPPLTANAVHWVRVSNEVGSTDSNTTTTTVHDPIVIQSQPQGQTVLAGESVSLAIEATGGDDLSYVWRRNGVAIEGANEPEYTFSPAFGEGGVFTVRLSNPVQNVTSESATIVVQSSPFLVGSTGGGNYSSGDTATLNASIDGTTPITHVWSFEGDSIAGVSDSTLVLEDLSTFNHGTYTLTSSNAFGSIETTFAVLMETPPGILSFAVPNEADFNTSVSLTVAANGAGPLEYFWFFGEAGDTSTPFGSNNATVNTGALTETTKVWVRVTNPFGSVDSDTRTIQVSPVADPPTAPTLTLQALDFRSVEIEWDAEEAVTAQAFVARAGQTPQLLATSAAAATSGSFTLAPLASKTDYEVTVTITSVGGGSASSMLAITTLPKVDLSLATADLVIAPAAPALGEPWSASVTVRNPGDVAAAGELVISLRPPGGAMSEAARLPFAAIPAGGSALVTWDAPALLNTGFHQIELALDGVDPADDVPTNDFAGPVGFQSGAPSLRLEWIPAPASATPGDSRTLAVALANTGSQPATVDDLVVIEGPDWLTPTAILPVDPLAPGAEWFAAFAMEVPADAPAGTVEDPARHSFRLRATSGGVDFEGDFELALYPAGSASIEVEISDASTGLPISGALVAGGDTGTGLTTDSEGMATVFVLPGTQTVVAFAEGYLPGQAVLLAEPGANSLNLALEPGDALAISGVSATELSSEEIAARGLALDDPENSLVFDFELTTPIDVLVLNNFVLPLDPAEGETVSGNFALDDLNLEYSLFYPVAGDPYQRIEVWVITPGKVRMLRQFWDVAVSVGNQTAAFEVEAATLGLQIPSGLSLPDLFGEAQTVMQALGDLSPGESATAEWVVRGDLPGTYLLGASASGTLRLGSLEIPLVGQAEGTEVRVVEPRIRVTAAPSVPEVFEGESFDLEVTVANLSPVALNGVVIELDPDRIENANIVEGETLRRVIGTLATGGETTVSFGLIPVVPEGMFMQAMAMGFEEPAMGLSGGTSRKFSIEVNPLPDQQTSLVTTLGLTLSESLSDIVMEPALESLVRDMLNKPEGELTLDDLASLTDLDLSGLGLTDPSALQHMTGLNTLDLRGNAFPSAEDLWGILDHLTLHSLLTDIPRPGGAPVGFSAFTLGTFDGDPLQIYVDPVQLASVDVSNLGFDPNESGNAAALQGLAGEGISVLGTASFSNWPVLAGLPADQRGPLDTHGPLDLANLLAYAKGLNPLTATPGDLPSVGAVDPEEDTVTFRYRRAKTTSGITLTPQTSTDLSDWQTATAQQTTVIEDGGDWEVIEIVVPAPPAGRLFFRLEAR